MPKGGQGALNPNKRFDRLIGMVEDKAIKEIKDAGFKSRITSRDGECFAGTCDYDLNRVNLGISKGKVVSVDLG